MRKFRQNQFWMANCFSKQVVLRECTCSTYSWACLSRLMVWFSFQSSGHTRLSQYQTCEDFQDQINEDQDWIIERTCWKYTQTYERFIYIIYKMCKYRNACARAILRRNRSKLITQLQIPSRQILGATSVHVAWMWNDHVQTLSLPLFLWIIVDIDVLLVLPCTHCFP